jgi:hypothetical protein
VNGIVVMVTETLERAQDLSDWSVLDLNPKVAEVFG